MNYFSSKGICIHFIQQGLKTLHANGTENPISKLVINILGVISEMERNQIKSGNFKVFKLLKREGFIKDELKERRKML